MIISRKFYFKKLLGLILLKPITVNTQIDFNFYIKALNLAIGLGIKDGKQGYINP